MRRQDWYVLFGLLATAVTGGVFIGQLVGQVERLAADVGDILGDPPPPPANRIEQGMLDFVSRTGSGRRGHVGDRVTFNEPFEAPPTVYAAISYIDIDTATNVRVRIMVQNVDEQGFNYRFETWGGTSVSRARAQWIAIPIPDTSD